MFPKIYAAPQGLKCRAVRLCDRQSLYDILFNIELRICTELDLTDKRKELVNTYDEEIPL